MLRLMIVDDEPLARRGLEQLLAAHPDVQVVAAVGSTIAARQALAEHKPDALLLDIALPHGAQGMELARQVPHLPPVIFVTAHAEHAVTAFDLDAVDYLLKPVRPGRLHDALQRLRRRLAMRPAPTLETGKRHAVGTLLLRTPERTVLAPLHEVIAIRADGDYCHVHIADQTSIMMLRPLTAFTDQLPSPQFVRPGRSWIINCTRVQAVHRPPVGHASVVLRGLEQPMTLSQRAAGRLADHLAQWRAASLGPG